MEPIAASAARAAALDLHGCMIAALQATTLPERSREIEEICGAAAAVLVPRTGRPGGLRRGYGDLGPLGVASGAVAGLEKSVFTHR